MQMPVYYNFILTFEQTPSAMKRIKLESRLQDIKYKTHRTFLQKVVVFIPLYQLYGKWQEVYEILVLGKSGGFISGYFFVSFRCSKMYKWDLAWVFTESVFTRLLAHL